MTPCFAKLILHELFCNLRADPVDAVKVGITWAGKWYIDPVIAFGGASGMAAFRVVVDAIAHIVGNHGSTILLYVDALVTVSPKDTADKNFDDLADLITDLGVPMNPDKKTPPCRTFTSLGMTIDIDS